MITTKKLDKFRMREVNKIILHKGKIQEGRIFDNQNGQKKDQFLNYLLFHLQYYLNVNIEQCYR